MRQQIMSGEDKDACLALNHAMEKIEPDCILEVSATEHVSKSVM